jgi:hypothetical protein
LEPSGIWLEIHTWCWAIGQLLQVEACLGSLVKNLLDSTVDENLKEQCKNGVYGVCVRSRYHIVILEEKKQVEIFCIKRLAHFYL